MSDPIASLTAEVERLAGLLRDANAEIARLRGEAPPTISGENPGPVNMSTATAYVPEDSSTWPMMDWGPDEPNMYRWPSGRGAVWLSGECWVAFRDTEFQSPVGLSYPTAAVAAAALRVRLPEEVAPTNPADDHRLQLAAIAKLSDRWAGPDRNAVDQVAAMLSYVRELETEGARYATLCSEAHAALDTAGIERGGTPAERIARLALVGSVAPKPSPTTDPPKLLIGMVVENEPGNAWLVGGTGSALMPRATAIYDTIADYRAGRALWRRP